MYTNCISNSCKRIIYMRSILRIPPLNNTNKLFVNKRCYRRKSTLHIPIATLPFGQFPTYSKLCKNGLSTEVNHIESVDVVTFEKVCDETLDSLCEYFEELVENAQHLNAADVTYSSGVLTVNFGPTYGTYVINRQSPNRQIWLSSPSSGPKRYDYVINGKYWIYRHDGRTLHQLLQDEIPKIVKTKVNFFKCLHSLSP